MSVRLERLQAIQNQPVPLSWPAIFFKCALEKVHSFIESGQASDEASPLRRTRAPCLDLEHVATPKQEICCSGMFGRRLQELAPIRKAVAAYDPRASEKLRVQ